MTDWGTSAAECRPERVSGAWEFAGTQIPLLALHANLASGSTINELVEWFARVNRQQVGTVLEHELTALRAPAAH